MESPCRPSSSASSAAASSATPISRAPAARIWSAVKACADLLPAVAAAKAAAYGIEAASIEELLADPEIAIVINLTVPLAHAEVSLRAVEAGKHVYSEKPVATTLRRGTSLDRGRARQGCAPRRRARHLPWRRPPGGPPGGRRRPDRPRGRRQRLLRDPRHGDLAPQPRLLLQARAAVRSSTSAPIR